MLETLIQDVRFALRMLRKNPGFTAVAVLTLALGIGANAAIFSVLEGVLLKPLPYPHPEQLIGVWHTAPGVGIKELSNSASLYFIYREQNTTFQGIGLYTGGSVSVTGIDEPKQVRVLQVTDGTLPTLGIQPMMGRLFTREDDSPGAPETVLLSYGYWRQKFGGAPSVIGRSITIDGKPREIIGVLPQGFNFLDQQDPALILPFQFDRNKLKLGNFSYGAIARLKPGVEMAQASADLTRMLPIANRSFPAPAGFSAKAFEDARIGPNLRPLKQDVVGDVGNVLLVLMGSIAVVLLIACANVANILLVRVEGRRQELAIRAALGASWGRIAAELLSESVILGLVGSLLGLALAYGALRVLVAMAPTGLPRIHEVTIDIPVLLFTLALALCSSLLFGSISVFKYAGAHLNTSLHEEGRAFSESRKQHRARNFLVVVQVALALVLLICSGLMIRTFRALMHVPPGFVSPDAVQTFRFDVPETEVPDSERERLVRMEEEIMNKLAAIPGVSSTGFASAIPMDGHNSMDLVFAQDHTYREGELPPIRRYKYVSPGFFATLGTQLVAGRDLTWTDTYQKIPVAIVSENFAREYWHDANSALGKRIRSDSVDDWREIIGVVADVYDDGVNKAAPTSVYWPIMMDRFEGEKEMLLRHVAFAIRSPRAGSDAFLKEIRQTVWSVDPSAPLADVHTLGYFYTKSRARTSFTLVMLGVAGGMALLLGVVGIYGVIAYSVSQRTREIGIRMALGAQRVDVLGMVVREGLLLCFIGIAIGIAGAFATTRLLKSLIFEVSPTDPVTFISVAVLLAVVALVACWTPARRATRVDPMVALRHE